VERRRRRHPCRARSRGAGRRRKKKTTRAFSNGQKQPIGWTKCFRESMLFPTFGSSLLFFPLCFSSFVFLVLSSVPFGTRWHYFQ
jgi:hypothetical protein